MYAATKTKKGACYLVPGTALDEIATTKTKRDGVLPGTSLDDKIWAVTAWNWVSNCPLIFVYSWIKVFTPLDYIVWHSVQTVAWYTPLQVELSGKMKMLSVAATIVSCRVLCCTIPRTFHPPPLLKTQRDNRAAGPWNKCRTYDTSTRPTTAVVDH